MKLKHIKLNYGPFTNFSLEIPESANFHLLYGPNEAGKTSLLRAIKALFFRMPLQSTDNFIHESSQLKIEAAIAGRDGSSLTVVRRKGKKSLFRLDGSPLDDSLLSDFCGGIGQTSFENLFALDHEVLRRGGEEILSGGGDVGQSLFEAGTGMAGLRKVLADLDLEAARLFKPGGSIPAINAALRQFADAKKKAKEAGALTEDWHKLNQERQKAEEDLASLNAKMLACAGDLERLKRIQGCRARLAERSRLEQELKNYDGLPELPPDCTQLRERLGTVIQKAEIQIADAGAGMVRLDSETRGLEVDQSVLEREPAITALHAEIGNYRSALRDIRTREGERSANQDAVLEIWRKLKPNEPLDRVDEYRLSQEQSSIVASLVEQHQRLETDLKVATQQLQNIPGSISDLEVRLLQLPSTVDTSNLDMAIREAEALGNIEERRLQAVRKTEELRKQATVKLNAQPLWKGALEEFERLQLPLRETVQRLATEAQEIQSQFSSTKKELEGLQREQRQLESKLSELTSAGEIASHDQLQAARRHRDRGWSLIKQSLFEEKISLDEAGAQFGALEPLDSAYEKTVGQADRVADLLRTDSKRTAEYGLLTASLSAIRGTAEALAKTQADIEATRREWERRWQEHWAALLEKPLTPPEMSAWLVKREEILSLAGSLRDQDVALQEMERQIGTARSYVSDALKKTLGGLGGEDEQLLLEGVERHVKAATVRLAKDLKKMLGDPAAEEEQLLLDGVKEQVRTARLQLSGTLKKMRGVPSEEEEQLRTLLSRARQCKETFLQWNSEREGIQKELKKLRLDHNLIERQVHAARSNLQTWSREWSAAIAPLRLAENHSPKLAEQFLKQMDALFSLLAEGKKTERRITGMTTIIQAFKAKAANLAGLVAPDLINAEADVAVETMTQRLKKFLNNAATREAYGKESNGLLSQRKKAETELGKAGERLNGLVAQAGCESLEQLEKTERRLADKRRYQLELEKLESQLVSDTGKPVRELMAESGQEDFNTLAYRISGIEKDLEELDASKIEKAKAVGDVRTRLKTIDGSEEAAASAQEAQQLLSRIKSGVLEYAKLAMAAELLRRTVDSFRDRNQGPLLTRASELMPRLTLGSIGSLRVGYGEKDDKIIVCVRADGREVNVRGLSDGTVDQLYLALRIAAIEKHIAENQPLPLMLDDILINYDDARAAVVLKVLQELSDRTGSQVLFFTHHLHLADIARRVTRCNVIDLLSLGSQMHRAAV